MDWNKNDIVFSCSKWKYNTYMINVNRCKYITGPFYTIVLVKIYRCNSALT